VCVQTEWRSLPRQKAAVAVVLVSAIIYNLPRYFERHVVMQACDGVALPRSERTEFRLNRDYFLIYKTACYFIFRAVGPLVALIALNAELVRALRAVRRRRRRLLVHKSKPRGGKTGAGENLTLMLVTVVTVFIVCQLPNVGIRFAVTALEFAPASAVGRLDMATLRYANVTTNALLTLNSAVNFAIYCLVGKKFRRIFLREVATCTRRPQPPPCSDDGESLTFRQPSAATTANHLGSRFAINDPNATQMTEFGQRSPRLGGGLVGKHSRQQATSAECTVAKNHLTLDL